MKEKVNIKDAPKPIGPYSQAVLSNNTLFISGQIPLDPYTGELIKGNIEAQTQQVLKNLDAILKEAGMDVNNVVKVSIFITDMGNFKKINEIYADYFGESLPARETVEVAGLPMNVDIEISLIAVK
jgi:2-iminobutanoate/2-iminopropanoate deaminase